MFKSRFEYRAHAHRILDEIAELAKNKSPENTKRFLYLREELARMKQSYDKKFKTKR